MGVTVVTAVLVNHVIAKIVNIMQINHLKKGGRMNLLKDLWAHIKEWSDWKMKDWIKAGIVAIIVIFIISSMTGGAA